jgi:hypothetical protein
MKRLILSITTVLALTAAGALVAQSPQNTTAPGPTQQLEPGQTNNNLPNPGNPVEVGPEGQQPLQEQGTVEGTATESITGAQGTNTTGTMSAPETETGTGVDVDVDAGSNAEGLLDVDVSSTTDADTDASGIDETGGLDNDTNLDTDTSLDSDTETALPATASKLPLLGLIGLLAFAAAFAVRRF